MLKATCCCCWHTIYERPVSPPTEPYGDLSVSLVVARPRPKLVKTENGYSSCCFLTKCSHSYSFCSIGIAKHPNVIPALLAVSSGVFPLWLSKMEVESISGCANAARNNLAEGGSGKGRRREIISKNNFWALTTWYVFLAVNEFT